MLTNHNIKAVQLHIPCSNLTHLHALLIEALLAPGADLINTLHGLDCLGNHLTVVLQSRAQEGSPQVHSLVARIGLLMSRSQQSKPMQLAAAAAAYLVRPVPLALQLKGGILCQLLASQLAIGYKHQAEEQQ
jgi:hypothetical protein